MNRREIRDAVRQEISETDSDVVLDPNDPEYDATQSGDFWTDAYLNRLIDEAYRRFCRAERWDWLWAVQGNIAVPEGSTSVEFINEIPANRHGLLQLKTDEASPRYITPVQVSPVEGVRLQRDYAGRTGDPEVFFVARNIDIEYEDDPSERAAIATLVPAPSEDMIAEYHYIQAPQGLTSETDEPVIPEQYHDALVAWAAGRAWLKELHSGKAREQFEIYDSILEDALREQRKFGISERVKWSNSSRRTLSDREWWSRHIPGQLG